MPQSYLEYPLPRGYIDNWLVAGPMALPLDAMVLLPVSPDHLGDFSVGETTLRWEYQSALQDHFLHLSDFYDGPTRAWLYTELVCSTAQTASFVIKSTAQVEMWVNGERVEDDADAFNLNAGPNTVLVMCSQPRGTTFLFALGCPDLEATVRLPCATEHTGRFQALEHLFAQAILDRNVFIAGDTPCLHWPENLIQEHNALMEDNSSPSVEQILLRLQKPDGRIYAETLGRPRPGAATKTIPAGNIPSGSYELTLMPRPQEYAEGQVRVRRTFYVNALATAAGTSDNRSYAERLYAAMRRALQSAGGLLSELAAMTLDAWSYVHPDVIAASAAVQANTLESDRATLVLLGMLARYEEHAKFPGTARAAVESRIKIRPYHVSNDSNDVQNLLAWAVALLAGQRYPAHTFSDGQSGAQLRTAAEAAAVTWLSDQGKYGVSTALDDGEMLDTLIFTLSHVADLAEDTLVRELAAVLLDKVLFSLALHQHRGIGPGGLLGTTACVSRVLWGMGILNTHLWGLVGLANARAYPIPPIVADIARDTTTVQIKEQIRGLGIRDQESGTHNHDSATSNQQPVSSLTFHVSRFTHRTSDYLLTSIQGTTPQDLGVPWAAVLGPEAFVYTNHPAHVGTHPAEHPNFWHGDGARPRVGQWRDALIARYDLPETTWLDFTHAYFPTYAFDETTFNDHWAFARKDQAYLALTAFASGDHASSPKYHVSRFTFHVSHPNELRASGYHTTWLCQLGRAADDGDFAAFRERVLKSKVDFVEDRVTWTTIRNDELSFRDGAPLMVNGEVQVLASDRHYATPYCTVDFPAEQMDIQYGEYLLRLDFRI